MHSKHPCELALADLAKYSRGNEEAVEICEANDEFEDPSLHPLIGPHLLVELQRERAHLLPRRAAA